MNRPAPIHLHIEELVLHGFPSGDRYRIAEAMQRELARLFTDNTTAPLLSETAERDRAEGGTFQMTQGTRPETTGVQAARAVFEGLAR